MGNKTSTPEHLQRPDKRKAVTFTLEDHTDDIPNDGKVRREVGALHLAIIDHCRDFYHDREIVLGPKDIEILLDREKDKFPTLSTTEFSHLLYDARSRRSAVTCFISHMVIKNIGFSGRKSSTLLSPSAVGCIDDFGFSDPEVKMSEVAEDVAFTQWRVVTAQLLPKIQKRPTIYQTARIDRLFKRIDETVLIFYDSVKDNTERLRSLRSVVEKAAIVGEMIFASPSRWKFDWHISRRDLRSRDRRSKDPKTPEKTHQAFDKGGKTIVIVRFPALLQIDAKDPNDKYGKMRARRGDYDCSSAISDVLREVRQGADSRDQPPISNLPEGEAT
ncbi:uncharacterized protein L3040_009525 [Drepanopeziza brunnea f. sp. 'multigermtubi']|uniref:uncharacterized protein n=1 Tax=Drepanopeziza brunnea f. sp. 'multigermtubi' TaxID=698441 RepID=UPI00238CF0F9|nr:hypothetical protein L3040_009525 [Drepanopeziza brunnea f. sp. 'multigermtubi']